MAVAKKDLKTLNVLLYFRLFLPTVKYWSMLKWKGKVKCVLMRQGFVLSSCQPFLFIHLEKRQVFCKRKGISMQPRWCFAEMDQWWALVRSRVTRDSEISQETNRRWNIENEIFKKRGTFEVLMSLLLQFGSERCGLSLASSPSTGCRYVAERDWQPHFIRQEPW